MAPQAKQCPVCKTPAVLDAAQCANCGHKFRTKFVADPPPSPAPSPVAPPPPVRVPTPIAPPVDPVHRISWPVIGGIALGVLVIGMVVVELLVPKSGSKLSSSDQQKVAQWLRRQSGFYLDTDFDISNKPRFDEALTKGEYRHFLIQISRGKGEFFTADSTNANRDIDWKKMYEGRIMGSTWQTPEKTMDFKLDDKGILTIDGRSYVKVPEVPLNNFEASLARDFRDDVVAGREPSTNIAILDKTLGADEP